MQYPREMERATNRKAGLGTEKHTMLVPPIRRSRLRAR